MIFTRANTDHKCTSCGGIISKGSNYVNFTNYYKSGTRKHCIVCVKSELEAIIK